MGNVQDHRRFRRLNSSVFDQIRGDRRFWSSLLREFQQEVQLVCLLLIQVDESNPKAQPMMVMPHLTFQI